MTLGVSFNFILNSLVNVKVRIDRRKEIEMVVAKRSRLKIQVFCSLSLSLSPLPLSFSALCTILWLASVLHITCRQILFNHQIKDLIFSSFLDFKNEFNFVNYAKCQHWLKWRWFRLNSLSWSDVSTRSRIYLAWSYCKSVSPLCVCQLVSPARVCIYICLLPGCLSPIKRLSVSISFLTVFVSWPLVFNSSGYKIYLPREKINLMRFKFWRKWRRLSRFLKYLDFAFV